MRPDDATSKFTKKRYLQRIIQNRNQNKKHKYNQMIAQSARISLQTQYRNHHIKIAIHHRHRKKLPKKRGIINLTKTRYNKQLVNADIIISGATDRIQHLKNTLSINSGRISYGNRRHRF